MKFHKIKGNFNHTKFIHKNLENSIYIYIYVFEKIVFEEQDSQVSNQEMEMETIGLGALDEP